MNDLQKMKLRQDGKSTVVNLNSVTSFYVWSDCHFFDKSIISFSDRPYTTASRITHSQIPAVHHMNEDLTKKMISSIPDNSFILNLGDLVDLVSVEAEEYISILNERLHSKGCILGIVLGNHDFLSDASKIDYCAWSGREEEFYKALGFDYVFVKPVTMIKPGHTKLLFTHKPVKAEVLEALDIDVQYHGHTHQYKDDCLYLKVDFDCTPITKKSINCCVDQTDPICIWSNKKGLNGSTTFVEKEVDPELYCPDPWLSK